jgi:molecular chaperone DnaJ
MNNPYKILGLNENASLLDIKAAFRRLSAKYHPDSGDDKNIEKFYQINEAYNDLKQEMKEIYGTLNLRENADIDEIDSEFKRQMEYLIIDRKSGDEKANEKIEKMRQAYLRLKSHFAQDESLQDDW